MILGLHVSRISLKNVLPYSAIITPLPGRMQTQDKGLLQDSDESSLVCGHCSTSLSKHSTGTSHRWPLGTGTD